jgi:hypothetical protein
MLGYVVRNQRQQLQSVDYNLTSIPTATFRNEPTSLKDDPPPPYEIPDANSQRGPARREWDNVAARIAARTAAARHSSKRSSRGDNPSRIQKAAARKHKPGLSIDTTVTRHIGSAPQQLQPKGSRKRASSGYKKLDEGTQASEIVPRTTKPQQALPAFEPSSFGASLVSHFSPETPTIVITPALDSRSSRFGARAASSLYSRATFAPSSINHDNAPPMPTNMPIFLEKYQPRVDANGNDGSRDSVATDFEEEEHEQNAKKHERAVSTATVFEEEEDQTPLTVPARNGKNGQDLYIDTAIPPTPRRSRGWWNVITTPFENAKSMSRYLRSPTDGSRTPDVPPLPGNMMSATQQSKGNTLSPESARAAWSPHSQLQNQQQSHNENISIYFNKSAAAGAQSSLPNSEKSYPNPRATHNSQALRRLESDELLISEPVPPLPVPLTRAAKESIHDMVSPNEREVPIVLTFNPTFIVNQPSNPYYPNTTQGSEAAGPGMTMQYQPNSSLQSHDVPNQSTQSNMPGLVGQGVAMGSQKKAVAEQEQSPQSGLTEFSPVGQIAGTGTVVSSKVVIKDGMEALPNTQTRGFHNHSLSSTSRSSLAAEIVKHQSPGMPYRSDQWRSPDYGSPQSGRQKAVPQPIQVVAFQPPPRSTSQPPARFSDYTVKTGKVKRKPLMFEICVRKPKAPKAPKDSKKTKKSKKRWCCCCLCFILLLLVGVAITLAIILSRKHASSTRTPTQTQIQTDTSTFITVTNFPPVPTGTLTIARPDLLTSVSGCVNPGTMWSCAVPKEQQASIAPNSPDQPDFVVNIVYDNSSTLSTRRLRTRQPSSGTFRARSWVKGALLRDRDASASSTFTPSPAPPTLEDQAFLGKTTDNLTSPFEGESTPFFISFTPPAPGTPTSKGKVKRQNSSSPSSAASSTVNVIPNIATALPLPSSQPDGTAEPANLLPFPVLQPLRLYNRGLADEHYGFYTYFERNIFMQSISIQNTSQQLMGSIPADENGGSTFVGARARCSWRDTRFKVQIWTNKNNSTSLLPPPSGSTTAKSSSTTQSFVRPGTFPYPVTITLDRHGGGVSTKMLFCYGMDDRGHIDVNAGQFQPENRSFAGTLVNPALGPFTNVNVTAAQGGPGGIDGGSGGCLCEWSNFLPK